MSKARNMARMGQDTSAGYTGAFDMPAGTTAERPASAGLGWTRLNTDSGSVEIYDGTSWNSVTRPFLMSVTGTIYTGTTSNLVIAGQNFTSTITVRFIEGGSTIADVTGVAVTSGSATVAVPAAVYGQTAGDSIEIKVLNSDGTISANGITTTVMSPPTGGTITTAGGYRIHTFNSSGTFTVPTGLTLSNVEYLVIAGGGGGDSNRGAGGGGAGGYRCSVVGESSGGGSSAESRLTLTASAYTVTIGAGGVGRPYGGSPDSTNGSNSVFNTITSTGGGWGNSNNRAAPHNGNSGGCGGGAGSAVNTGGTGGAGTSGQGYAGGSTSGDALAGDQEAGGGGGGAGAVGGSTSTRTQAGAGGSGVSSSITGTAVTRGGGGGGGKNGASSGAGAGGSGGGGAGCAGSGTQAGLFATAGTANTGGGGGAGGANAANGANGGSGVVIVRYAL